MVLSGGRRVDRAKVLAVLAALLLQDLVQDAHSAVDEGCMSCLCQAATGCDANRDCDAAGTCGMFAISQQFWKDAGSPSGDYETCALDPACATQCVQAYMQTFARDCDGDGVVGCTDYCRLHHLGREGCGGALDGAFAGRLASCNASIPLGDFYARAVARPARQGRQGSSSWQGAPQSSGGGPSASFNPSVSYSKSVTVAPSYRNGGGGGFSTPSTGYQNGRYQTAGVQGGASGYLTGYQNGYRSGGGYSGYEEGGYLSSGYRGAGAYGQSGGYRGALWGAGETGGYSGRYSGGYGHRGATARGGAVSRRPVSSACLACICNALTGCDPLAGCSNGGCGAFKISPVYWQDCGSPGQSYEYCTRDYACSSSCAQAYLSKYAQDCNGDGVIDCRDYSRIHRLGGFGCNGPLDEPYRSYVDSCPS